MLRHVLVGVFAGPLLLLVGCRLGPHPTLPAPRSAPYAAPPLGKMVPVPVPVSDALPAPYESICRSVVNRRLVFIGGSNYVSSGALLGDNMLLTAAHNYASPRAPFSVVRDRSVECGTGVASATLPWWRVEGGFDRKQQIRHPQDFRNYDWSKDFALVALKAHAPQASAFRLPQAGEALIAKGSVVFIAGYPAEGENTGSLLHYGRVTVTEVTENEIVYDLDTEKGLSGSPVWVEKNGDFVLVGVHVAEKTAHRLSDASLRNLATWREEFQRALATDGTHTP